MGLRKKTFLYSVVLALIMIVFVIGYFVLMLPSLYVDYVMNSNLQSAAQIQIRYMEERSYDHLTVKNPSSVFTMEIPNTGDEVYLAGKFYRLTVVVRDEELQSLLNRTRQIMGKVESLEQLENMDDLWTADREDTTDGLGQEDFKEFVSKWQDKLKEIFAGQNLISEDFPIEVKLEQRDNEQVYSGEYSKVHMMSGDVIVYEAGVSGGNYSYTTYVAMGRTQDALIITVLPTMTPQMEEITPIVMGSLPMIVSVIFLVVLVSSGFFAGRIVNPIIRLANHAESAGIAGHFKTDEFAFVSDRKDEIGTLERNLQELYTRLRDSYEDLACKNHMLEEENERREVFLRASSHQLKTPIAAALLLVEGMLNEVGKYKDTKIYLPEVKQQLLSMRKIVEDILYLNYHAKDMQQEDVAVEVLAQELVRAYAVQAEDKKLQVIIDGKGIVQTDREMLKKIADNLLSNAVQYTPEQQKIVIEINDTKLCMTNYGVTIDEELLPNVFEPFVSSDGSRKGRGLGLYVAKYYSKLAGYKLKIENIENGVRTELYFRKVTAQ
ncbi:MAG: HAMP domain-containing histidine kinase [Lachnospiraceae bacterium]|nr:HAMP domain-containing histidine kinase [Lachnospiraceae bacterium]